MRTLVPRGLVVALIVSAFLGADIALAGATAEPVRHPVGPVSHAQQQETVTVVKGDHLWKISKRHLEVRMQRRPSNSEISPYWRQVIDENAENLRSGDPDLIYPGELIELPEARLSEQQ